MSKLRAVVSIAVVLVSGVFPVTLGAAGQAQSVPATVPESAVLSPTAGPYFGPILDWSTDSANAYRQRLGRSPAYFGKSIQYPLTGTQRTNLTNFVRQISVLGAAALLTMEPTAALNDLTASDANAFVAEMKALHARYGTDFLVRFAPEMNGTWHAWGQQPKAYVRAFGVVADAVHSGLDRATAQMMWAPSYGAGYPFRNAVGKVAGSGARTSAQLDTNRDGVVDAVDDPYAPYYPRDSAVDWVGLSMYDYGPAQQYGANIVPGPGKYAKMLAGTYGYQTRTGAGRDFLATYSTGKHKLMAVETAALYQNGQAGAPTEMAVKHAWWDQVLNSAVQRRYPAIKLVAWLEQQRAESEVLGAEIDWRATATPALAGALATALQDDRIALGPVLKPRVDTAAPTRAAPSSTSRSGTTVASGVVAMLIAGLAVLLIGRRRRQTAAPSGQPALQRATLTTRGSRGQD